MIEITRDGNQVVFTATAKYPLHGQEFAGRYTASSEWSATLLWQHLQDHMQSEIRSIREKEYQRGWKDAKAHATKESWFSGLWK